MPVEVVDLMQPSSAPAAAAVSATMAPDFALSSPVGITVSEDGAGNVLVSVDPPAQGPGPKLDICIVIDTSGSMGDSANPKGAEDVKLFTKMDLAKRGAEVIAHALGPNDTLSILGFDSEVKLVLPRTAMTPEGLSRALAALSGLQPCGGTALWDGLQAGLMLMEGGTGPAQPGPRYPVVVLLTDGLPSPSPPAGEIAELKKYLAERDAAVHKRDECRTPCKLVTMGFGYDVNSKLLQELSDTHGSGAGSDFAFIPDGSMLLTTFVNLMANLQSTCARYCSLYITPPTQVVRAESDAPSAPPLVDLVNAMDAAFAGTSLNPSARAPQAVPAVQTENAAPVRISSLVTVPGEVVWKQYAVPGSGGSGLEVRLGDLLYGQPRQLVLRLKDGSTNSTGGGSAAADWRSWVLRPSLQPTSVGLEVSTDSAGGHLVLGAAARLDELLVTQQLHRALGVSCITQAARVAGVDPEGARGAVKKVALEAMALQGGPQLGGLGPHPILEDLLGQVSEALGSSEAWSRWGQHYVRSLTCAHKAQACNNFKDPGVLAYGGDYTMQRRDALNAMCDSLPVPVPSLAPSYGVAMGTPVSAATFRNAFNNRYGGCFGGEGRVRMADGSTKRVKDLRAGDQVAVPSTAPSTAPTLGASDAAGSYTAGRVVCVVAYSGVRPVRLPGSGLVITAWHPVRDPASGAWRFPADLAAEALAERYVGSTLDEAVQAVLQPEQEVYNLVLEAGHVVEVDGVACVTLGHGFQEDVVRHPFFGTQAVVRELQALPGWRLGWVHLGHMGAAAGATATAKLDPQTGLVCSLVGTRA